ncbi:DNA-processing protein DprA [Hydrogenimonas cancrithermarum]|uniref:DNA protecting protein DprA n=1 Tax=Hydrogenimonas cancrithermarum TaxID=2993563 RepID=A0ABN6WTF0_9BACT|nr:DNA-processing protein DprA [Hydrogenimonas cancrithermarum]BDY12266.1 DNA protecting protein DprA [Hydrogenimonas cancrithermarum]
MIERIDFRIEALEAMKRYPETLYCIGNTGLLEARKVSIVGTRRPNSYTKRMVMQLAASLSRRGVVVVSGAAMGVDALAHRGAGSERTIAVMGSGLDIRYPAVNASLIEEIERKGLVLSRFEPGFKAAPWSFVVRNEMVVALGEVLVVAQADRKSGTMRSVEFAKAMGKPIYVFPHRLGESEGSNDLLKEGRAEAIFDIESFTDMFGERGSSEEDEFMAFCRTSPSYEEALKRFGQRVFEAELEGVVAVCDGRLVLR